MATDTKVIIRKGTSIDQIAQAISAKYSDVLVHSTRSDFMYISFKDGEDNRQLAVSFTNSCERESGISGVWCSIGMWGNSLEIAKYLGENFGGFIDENDCDDEGFYPINFEAYSQGSEFTNLDLFKHKVIVKFGYENLKGAMELFEEFKTLS